MNYQALIEKLHTDGCPTEELRTFVEQLAAAIRSEGIPIVVLSGVTETAAACAMLAAEQTSTPLLWERDDGGWTLSVGPHILEL